MVEKDINESASQVLSQESEKEISSEPPEAQSSEEIVLPESDEEIKRNKEAGLKQCPTCNKLDSYRAFIDIGIQSYYCPHCKRPIEVKPWVRFWARHCDYIIFFFCFGIVCYTTIPSIMNLLFKSENKYASTFIILFIYNFAEAGLLSTCGYTPSKWLLGISVRDKNMNKLSYEVALTRAIRVWWRGIGIGFPIVYIITQINAYNKLKYNLITTWDNDGDLTVAHNKPYPSNIIITVLVYLVFVFLLAINIK